MPHNTMDCSPFKPELESPNSDTSTLRGPPFAPLTVGFRKGQSRPSQTNSAEADLPPLPPASPGKSNYFGSPSGQHGFTVDLNLQKVRVSPMSKRSVAPCVPPAASTGAVESMHRSSACNYWRSAQVGLEGWIVAQHKKHNKIRGLLLARTRHVYQSCVPTSTYFPQPTAERRRTSQLGERVDHRGAQGNYWER
jgi:hypothetical protein